MVDRLVSFTQNFWVLGAGDAVRFEETGLRLTSSLLIAVVLSLVDIARWQ